VYCVGVAVTPPSQPSIKVTYSMPYRGGTKNWSNRYFFSGANFTGAQFTALCAAMEGDLKQQLPTDCSIIRYTRYDAGSDVPVTTVAVSVAGTMSLTGRTHMTGESCCLIRFSTSQRTSKNHPIYLFKYIHGVILSNGQPGDVIDTTQQGRFATFAADCVTGFSDGTSTRHITGPYGAVAIGQFTSTYAHHRDFPT
jgi:hypothetical protein